MVNFYRNGNSASRKNKMGRKTRSCPYKKLPASGYLAISMLVSFSALRRRCLLRRHGGRRGARLLSCASTVYKPFCRSRSRRRILGAVLLHAPGGALRTAFLGIFRAAHVVGNPTRSTSRRQAKQRGSDKQGQGGQKEKSRFHGKSPHRYRINPSADKFQAPTTRRACPVEGKPRGIFGIQ